VTLDNLCDGAKENQGKHKNIRRKRVWRLLSTITTNISTEPGPGVQRKGGGFGDAGEEKLRAVVLGEPDPGMTEFGGVVVFVVLNGRQKGGGYCGMEKWVPAAIGGSGHERARTQIR